MQMVTIILSLMKILKVSTRVDKSTCSLSVIHFSDLIPEKIMQQVEGRTILICIMPAFLFNKKDKIAIKLTKNKSTKKE